MKSLAAIVVLLHLQVGVHCVFTGDHSSDALYTQLGLQNVRKTINHQTVFSYPTPDSSLEIVERPRQDDIWKNYVLPMVHDSSFIRPVRSNCQTELIYQKEIMDEPDCGWVRPVIIRPTPTAKAKLEVVKVRKSGLSDAFNLANLLYHNEPINYSEPHLGKRKKEHEVVVNVNLGARKNRKGKYGVVTQVEDPAKNRIGVVEPVKKSPVLGGVLDSKLHPHHLLRNGKIQLKETQLSEHDSVVEVFLPQQSGKKSCDLKQDPQSDCDSDKVVTTPGPCSDTKTERPIIKNRFVVLHLKEGDRIIRDPLLRFCTRV